MWGKLTTILVLFLGVHLNLALGLTFQVYRDLNHQGMIYDFDVGKLAADECHTMRKYAQGSAASVRTDACVLAYEGEGCTGYSVKLEEPGDAALMKTISSFHLCNDTHGGKLIRTDMYEADNLLAEYKDICGCQDLPTSVSSKVNKINNYGNCITVFATESCAGQSIEIPAGVSPISENLATWGYYPRSVSACGVSPACIRLHSKIYKFDLIFNEDGEEPGSMKEVELAAKTTFYNNGSATVTQEYMASRTVKETVTVTRSQTIAQMESSSVENTVTTTNTVKVGGWFWSATSSVTNSLKTAYGSSNYSESSESAQHEHSEEKTFAVTQTIQIPPCVEYVVSSTVSMIENAPVEYWIYTKVKGTSSGLPILAQDLQPHVKGMEYVENYDNLTAIFRSKHVAMASVGVDTWITGEGSKIEGCVP